MYKCKSNKYVRIMVITVLCMVLLSTVALADTYHAGANWNIPGANSRSRTHTWTAQATSSSWYVATMADTVNTGAETTYYKVAITSGGTGTSQVACNLGGLSRRNVNGTGTISSGARNGTYAWRVDDTLNTDIVDGITKIYSR